MAGTGWGVNLAMASATLALSNPEVLSKIASFLIATMALALGFYWIIKLTRFLIGSRYHFPLNEKNSLGEWVIKGEPKRRRVYSYAYLVHLK